MHRLLAVVVSAVAATFADAGGGGGREVVVTWRHYGYDTDDVWFLDVEFPAPGSCLQIARAVSF